MTTRVALLAGSLLLLGLVAPPPVSALPQATAAGKARLAGCNTVAYGGRTFVLYKTGVTCAFARRWVRTLNRTRRGPRGWTCSSGSRFRTGGFCQKGRRYQFGWHPGD
jgi:hypothetical protein